MKLIIYNGSPRGKRGNTDFLINQFIQGFCEQNENEAVVYYLSDKRNRDEQVKAFEQGHMIIFAMPLYCDAMPGCVKEFLEILPAAGNLKRKMGFIVQSGFQEAYQSSFLKAYFDTIPTFFSCEYLGTVVRGGVEGIQVMPPFMVRKVLNHFMELGRNLALTSRFDENIMNQLARPYTYSKWELFLYKYLFAKSSDGYWNRQLKKNGCFEKRFDAPYISNQ